MMAALICTNCGHDLEAGERIEDGCFAWSPGRGFMVDGEPLTFAPQQAKLLAMVIQARGEIVPRETLFAHLSEVSRGKVLDVIMCRIRDAFDRLGVPCPIEVVWGEGLRWNVDAAQPVTRRRIAA